MRTRWVLDASGRRAILRHQLDLLATVGWDPGQNPYNATISVTVMELPIQLG